MSPENLPAVVPPADDELSIESFAGANLQYATTFPIDTPPGVALVHKAMDVPEIDLLLSKDKTLDVANVVIFRDKSLNRQTGELSTRTKIRLILVDGTVFGCSSPSAVESFRKAIVLMGGLQNFRLGTRFKVVAHDGGAPGPYYTLQLVE